MKLMTSLLILTMHIGTVQAEEAPIAIRMALIVPMSSPIHDVAQEALNGATLGLTEGARRLSSWSGMKGNFRFEFEYFDDRGSGEAAQKIAHSIVAGGRHAAVVGGVNSGTAIPAAKIYEDAGLINISIGATNPTLTRSGHRWAYRMSMDDTQLASKTYQALHQRFKDLPAAFVYDGTAYGEFTADGFATKHRTMTEKSGPWLNLGETGSANKIGSHVSGPEAVIYIGGMDLFATKVANSLPKNTHWTIVGGDGLCSAHMAKIAASLDMSLICASQERKDVVPVTNPLFEDHYKSKFGHPPSSTAAAAFDATALLVEAFGQREDWSKADIRDHLHSGTPFAGANGPVAFDASGDNTLAPGYLYEATNGGWRFLRMLP